LRRKYLHARLALRWRKTQ